MNDEFREELAQVFVDAFNRQCVMSGQIPNPKWSELEDDHKSALIAGIGAVITAIDDRAQVPL